MSVQQSHEVEIVTPVREEPTTVVSAQDDVVWDAFEDLADRSRHGATLSVVTCGRFPNGSPLRF
jgi:hypothetical protein